MRSADLIRNARLSTGLTQAELAARAGLTQAHVSRLESGKAEPPFSTLIRLVEASDRAISLELFTPDTSLHRLADDQLKLEPWERVRKLLGDRGTLPGLQRAVEVAAGIPGGALLTGPVASVLQGGVYVLPAPTIELVPARIGEACTHLTANGWDPFTLEDDDLTALDHVGLIPHDLALPTVELIPRPPGTRGYADLARDATTLPGVPVPVVSVRDLLRIAERSPFVKDQNRRLEQRALLDLDDPANPPDLTNFTG